MWWRCRAKGKREKVAPRATSCIFSPGETRCELRSRRRPLPAAALSLLTNLLGRPEAFVGLKASTMRRTLSVVKADPGSVSP